MGNCLVTMATLGESVMTDEVCFSEVREVVSVARQQSLRGACCCLPANIFIVRLLFDGFGPSHHQTSYHSGNHWAGRSRLFRAPRSPGPLPSRVRAAFVTTSIVIHRKRLLSGLKSPLSLHWSARRLRLLPAPAAFWSPRPHQNSLMQRPNRGHWSVSPGSIGSASPGRKRGGGGGRDARWRGRHLSCSGLGLGGTRDVRVTSNVLGGHGKDGCVLTQQSQNTFRTQRFLLKSHLII